MDLSIPEPSDVLFYGFLALLIPTVLAAWFGLRQSEGPAQDPSPDQDQNQDQDQDQTGGRSRFPNGAVLLGLAVWMGITAAVSLSGLSARWDLRPPPIMALVMVGLVLTGALALGPLGKRVAMGVPVAGLIAFQAFRFPLELLLHRAYVDGLMPVQMSYSGRNFDIVTGVTALLLGGAYLATKGQVPRGLAWAFNILGLGLLFNIVGIAVASMPVFAAFGPEQLNVWITDFPFVWLPAVFVTFALFGHIVLTRRLLADP